jgi:glycosyltransferase involved in cell wall biosynthesis
MLTNLLKYKVSVIITVFNRKKRLIRAIKSVLNQTYKNYEVIIIDDGSTDGVEKIIFPILKANHNFKYIRHSNRHTVLSLNTGLKIAEGKFITFLDSDDEYAPDHLLKRINYFSKNKYLDLIHSPTSLIGKEEDFYIPDANNKNKLVHLNDCIIGATLFGKKEVFEKLDGFRKIFSYDSDFYKRAKKEFNVLEFNLPTYIYYRDSKDSVLTSMKNKMKNK